jgi:hypothetical protein
MADVLDGGRREGIPVFETFEEAEATHEITPDR